MVEPKADTGKYFNLKHNLLISEQLHFFAIDIVWFFHPGTIIDGVIYAMDSHDFTGEDR